MCQHRSDSEYLLQPAPLFRKCHKGGVEFLRRLRYDLVSLQPVLSGGIYAAPTKRHRENSVGDAYMRPENHVRTATGDALTVRKYPGLPSHGTAGPGGLLCNYRVIRPRRRTVCPETPGCWGPHTSQSFANSSMSFTKTEIQTALFSRTSASIKTPFSSET